MGNNSYQSFQQAQPHSFTIEKAVDRLADLLSETIEVRELIRLAQEIKADYDVHRIALGIKDIKAAEGDNKKGVLDELLRQREALPVVMKYRRTEQAVRELFCAADQIISSAAGVDFAEHARANLELLRSQKSENSDLANYTQNSSDKGCQSALLTEEIKLAAVNLGEVLAASPELQDLNILRDDGNQYELVERQIETSKALFARTSQRLSTTLGVRYTDFVR